MQLDFPALSNASNLGFGTRYKQKDSRRAAAVPQTRIFNGNTRTACEFIPLFLFPSTDLSDVQCLRLEGFSTQISHLL